MGADDGVMATTVGARGGAEGNSSMLPPRKVRHENSNDESERAMRTSEHAHSLSGLCGVADSLLEVSYDVGVSDDTEYDQPLSHDFVPDEGETSSPSGPGLGSDLGLQIREPDHEMNTRSAGDLGLQIREPDHEMSLRSARSRRRADRRGRWGACALAVLMALLLGAMVATTAHPRRVPPWEPERGGLLPSSWSGAGGPTLGLRELGSSPGLTWLGSTSLHH